MFLRNKTTCNHPFTLIAGQGLGYLSESKQTDLPVSHRLFGQAKLNYAVNIATGNLVAQDHVISIPDVNGPVEFSYLYNSLETDPASAWKLNVGRRIKLDKLAEQASIFDKAKSFFYTNTPSITVIEADGHESNYILKEDGCYYLTDCQDGMPCIKIDKENNTYTWYHPKSRHTEYFDAKGNLTKRVDEAGNETVYEYNAAGELQAIVAASRTRYEIRRNGQSVKIFLVELDKKEKLLHFYQFENGKLKTSTTSDNYEINYLYDGGKLKQASQSDGSTVKFGYYSSSDANKNKLQTIQVGDDEFNKNVNTFIYEGDKSTFIDASQVKASFKLDANKRVQDFSQETKDEEKEDNIHYEYTQQGQVEKRVYPDGSLERFEYDAKLGLLSKHIRRDKTATKHVYSCDEKDTRPVLISKIELADEKNEDKPLAISRYIYEPSLKNNTQLLRYEITPEGRVKEYNHKPNGLVESEHYYLDLYVTGGKIPTLSDMDKWKSLEGRSLNKTSIFHDYDSKGRLIKTWQDSDKGPETQYEYDDVGLLKNTLIKQLTKDGKSKYLKTNYKFNDNGDLLEKKVGDDSKLSQKTSHQYKTNKIITVNPNGSTEIQELDSRNLVQSLTATVPDEKFENTHSYKRDANGSVHAEMLADGNQVTSLYDKQNRLKFSVTPEGAVTKFGYNKKCRYQKKTEYATTVDIKHLEDLEHFGLTIDEENDRSSYTFFGLNDEIRFTVDAENHLIEHQYDSLGNLSKIINYAEKISDEELELLISGKELTRKPDCTKDQVLSYFYDKDGKKVAEQNALGFVTKFERDGAGRITKEIRYSTRCLKIANSLEEILPPENKEKDSHTLFFYNSLNQCVLEVDAEGYVTTHSYYSDGQKQSSIRYETPVDSAWKNKTIPPVPVASKKENDQTTIYSYDDIGRLEAIRESSGKITRYSYDEMNNRTESYSQDTTFQLTVDNIGDTYRGSQFKFDGWGQVIAEADPLVKEQIIKISLSSFSEVEKERQIKEIWSQKAKRNDYNEVGLKIKIKDQLGHDTLNYYDKDGNLVLIIDASGAVTENTYNAFKEVKTECRYYNRIATEILSTLKGGYVSEDLLKLIKKDASHDAVTIYKRDRKGNIIQKIDPELNASTYEYNAFNKCTLEILPVASNTSALKVIHEYDTCNNEIKKTTKPTTVTTASLEPDGILSQTKVLSDHFSKVGEIKSLEQKQSIVIETKYDHFSGKPTEIVNELGGRTKLEVDKLGRIKQIDKELKKDVFITDSKIEYDGLSQVTKLTNAENQTTVIEHNQKDRTHVVHSPIADSKEIIKENIFGQTIEKQDGELNKETIRHASDGQVNEHRVGDKVTTTKHNLLGMIEEQVDPAKVKTKLHYNAANQLTRKIEDADDKGLNLTLQFEPNAFGQNEKEIDARKVESNQEFNRCGKLIKKTSDPSDKALITQYVRDASGNETNRIMGDAKSLDQMHVATEYDTFGRKSANVIDPKTLSRSEKLPEALDIRTQFERDAAGNITKEIDPNGNTKRSYYDLQNRKNIELKPISPTQYLLTEWSHTRSGKISCVRTYNTAIDAKLISDNTTLDDLKASSKPDNNNDSVVLYFYDAKDREKFIVTLVWDEVASKFYGMVVEKQYNKADKEIGQISYHNTLNADQYTKWSTEKLIELVVPNADLDRAVKHWRNAESQIRFTLNQDGLIVEKRYDAKGRLIAEITYAESFNDSRNKTFDELIVDIQSKANLSRDQVSHKVYDNCGREIFIVKSDGAVTRKDYDENNNVTRVCQFKDFISKHATYEDLVVALNALDPDRNKDSITDTKYDNLGFIESIKDALGNIDTYERNVLGNLKTNTDREHNVKGFEFDRANRLVKEIAPKSKIAIVSRDTDGKLTFTEKVTTVTKKTDFDKAGNTTRITDGILEGESEDEKLAHFRVLDMAYDPGKELLGTEQPKTLVDDDSKPANLVSMPVVSVTLKTKSILNTKGKKIVEINEAGVCTFKVYDNAGRMIFLIDGEKSVTEYRYNNFDQQTYVIKYANKLEDDLTQYSETGILPSTITNALHLIKCPDDRIEEREYSRSGKLINVKSGPVFYYSNGKSGIAQPESKKEFNLLGDCVKESRLISPGVWASKYTWFDSCGRTIAQVNEKNHLTRYTFNSAGKEEFKSEYAEPLSIDLSITTLIEELDESKTENSKDRYYKYEYDLLGQKISEITRNVTIQKLVLDEKSSVPHLESVENKGLIRRWEYSPTQKETRIFHEDGSSERKFYDARGIKIAETEVSRQSEDASGYKITITPLTIIKPNVFGQAAVSQKSKKGGAPTDEKGSVPELITIDPKDLIQDVSLHDNRGLVNLKQDAEQNLQGFTYTPTRKTARELATVTLWAKNHSAKVPDEKEHKTPQATDFIKEKHLNEKRKKYNKCDKPIQETLLRDGMTEQETHSRYNTFSEVTGKSNDGINWELVNKIDNNGSVWFSTSANGGAIKLYDLRGAETLQLQSTDVNLGLVNYNDAEFATLLATDSKALERTETIRDEAAHEIARKFPIWFKDKKSLPTRTYKPDRWGNIVTEFDSNGNQTDTDFNHRDKPIKRTLPEVDVAEVKDRKPIRDEKGNFPRKRPVMLHGYNARGFDVGTRDANGHTTGSVVDEAGQVVDSILSDGTRAEHTIFNAVGKETSTINSKGDRTRYEHDRKGNIIAEHPPLANGARYFGYDEVDNRNSDTDAQGNTIRYNSDARKNVKERFLPLGQLTRTGWDRNGQQLAVMNADGNLMIWERDFFGIVKHHIDLEGRKYGYDRNFKNGLKHQYLLSGTTFVTVSVDKNIIYPPGDVKGEFPAVSFVPKSFNSKPQDIVYTYAYGLLESVLDNGLDKLTTYQHDSEARQEFLEVRSASSEHKLLYSIKTIRDELGRESFTTDIRLSVTTFYSVLTAVKKYDAVSNLVNTKISLTPAGFSAECKVEPKITDSWNLFDAADRVILSDGVLSPQGTVQLAPLHGFEIEHKNGFRAQEKSLGPKGEAVVADITFDENERLKTIICDLLKIDSGFSDAGYRDTYIETYKGVLTQRKAKFDENAWQQEEVATDAIGVVSILESKNYLATGVSGTDILQDVRAGAIDTRSNSYINTTTPSLNKVTAVRTTKDGRSDDSVAHLLHDANFTPNGKVNSSDEFFGELEPDIVGIETTSDGWLMDRQNILDRMCRQENYSRNISGDLLAGYTTGYFDIKSHAPQPILLLSTFPIANNAEYFAYFEGLLKDGTIPYSSGVALHAPYAIYFVNKKLIRNPIGIVIIGTVGISDDERSKLPVIGNIGIKYRIIGRERAPWLYDRVMTRVLTKVGFNQPDFMQIEHMESHKNGKEVQPDVGNVVLYSAIHPIARTTPTDKAARNNPLNWDEPVLLQQLGLPTYIVNPGDTFKSIAKRFGGDVDAAGKIATVNGFSPLSHELKPGLFLRIPQIIPSKNKADSLRPEQDFMRVAIGCLSPPLVMPVPPLPPQHKNHHSFFGTVVKIIAIAIVCAVAPELAGFLLPMATGIGAVMATGVIAALGDAVVQKVAIALHAQDKFSFAEMLETGVTAGIGSTLGAGKDLTTLATNALIIGTAAVATQFGEIVVGLRSKFDASAIFVQIAASVAAAKISEGVDGVLDAKSMMSIAAKSIANTTSSALLGSAVTHTPMDIRYMAANAMGSAVGSEMSSKLGEHFDSSTPDSSLPTNSLKPEISDVRSTSISIDANDSRWHSGLSEMSSRQRQAATMKANGSHDYLSDPSRQEKYRHMLFNRPASDAKPVQPTLKTAPSAESASWIKRAANSPLVTYLVEDFNPVITIPRHSAQAYRSFRSGDVRGGFSASGEVILDAFSVAGEGLLVKGAMGIRASRLGLFSKGASVAETQAAKETYLLESPRENLIKNVENGKLRDLIDRTYREKAKIASGSTADAIRHEIRTGELLSRSGHMQKGIETRSVLSKLIDSGRLGQRDQDIARWMRKDIQDALSEERIHTQTVKNRY